jgi:hypothetical protein
VVYFLHNATAQFYGPFCFPSAFIVALVASATSRARITFPDLISDTAIWNYNCVGVEQIWILDFRNDLAATKEVKLAKKQRTLHGFGTVCVVHDRLSLFVSLTLQPCVIILYWRIESQLVAIQKYKMLRSLDILYCRMRCDAHQPILF